MPERDGEPPNYRRTEVLPQLIMVPIAAGVALVAVMNDAAQNWPVLAMIAAIALIVPFFAAITIVIEDGRLEVRFGPPIFRRVFEVRDITAARSIPQAHMHAWGVRRIRRSALRDAFLFGAVDIELRDGTAWRIGTRHPDELLAALRKAGVRNER